MNGLVNGSMKEGSSDKDQASWLRLNRAFIKNPALLTPLLQQHSIARDIWSAVKERVGQDKRWSNVLSFADEAGVQRDMDWLAAGTDRHLLTWADADYPQLLRELSVPPCLLFLIGDPALLQWPQIAMVGSRRPSISGLRTAARLAEELSSLGVAVTSGMAFGIDSEAHEAVLRTGGKTLAVLGSGLSKPYPVHPRDLFGRLSRQGVVISEFPTDMAPYPGNFPRRNRLISGLTRGTVVVEATERSGSLITARQALEQGREVFAVPGPIASRTSRGCHILLRQGAKLVETAIDIIEEFPSGFLPGGFSHKLSGDRSDHPADDAALSPPLQRMLKWVGYEGTRMDDIVAVSGLTVTQVSSMLCTLEIKGFIIIQWDGSYCRVK